MFSNPAILWPLPYFLLAPHIFSGPFHSHVLLIMSLILDINGHPLKFKWAPLMSSETFHVSNFRIIKWAPLMLSKSFVFQFFT